MGLSGRRVPHTNGPTVGVIFLMFEVLKRYRW